MTPSRSFSHLILSSRNITCSFSMTTTSRPGSPISWTGKLTNLNPTPNDWICIQNFQITWWQEQKPEKRGEPLKIYYSLDYEEGINMEAPLGSYPIMAILMPTPADYKKTELKKNNFNTIIQTHNRHLCDLIFCSTSNRRLQYNVRGRLLPSLQNRGSESKGRVSCIPRCWSRWWHASCFFYTTVVTKQAHDAPGVKRLPLHRTISCCKM